MREPMTKKELRAAVQAERKSMDPAWRAEQSAAIQARLLSLPQVASASVVGMYMALAGEADLGECFETLLDTGRGVCVPAFDAEVGGYALALVSGETRWIEAPFGLREPEEPVWADPASVNCVVVPGVAFDVRGRRVGHGGGHYDRMLCGMSAVKIAVAFDFQVFDCVPAETHDVAMDMVVTPTRTIVMHSDAELR